MEKREYIPISGKELAQVLLGMIADKLLESQWLGEGVAYPGAKVELGVRITPQPVEEGRSYAWQEQFVLDLTQPPDVVRILTGLPIWEKLKVGLDGLDVQVEKQTQAKPEVAEAARKVVEKGTSGPGSVRR